ncbi:PadR family transcriptional regulator [Pontibacillus salicampi]|uniref:PadR family transcriptional regulator n=1 Tax=Pontibacillus salicampi TaxID=1449801 RepID=A0ABV6LKR1_9BACI
MDREIMKGSIDILMLSLVAKKDMYGYEMVKRLKEESENLYHMSEGTLYPALKRLEKKGLLTSYWSETQAGRRKYYSITDDGKVVLQQKLNHWESINGLISKMSEDLL